MDAAPLAIDTPSETAILMRKQDKTLMKLDRAEILSLIATKGDELASTARGMFGGVHGHAVSAADLADSAARIGELISCLDQLPHPADSRRDLGKKLG